MKDLGMFDQHSGAMFNPLMKYMNQQNPDTMHSAKPSMYHPYDNSRMLSVFYQMQHHQQHQQQQQQQQQHLRSVDDCLPQRVASEVYSQQYLPSTRPQQQNSLPLQRTGYTAPKQWRSQHVNTLVRHVNTPGSLTSEGSESSGNESGTDEHISTSSRVPMDFSLKTVHQDTQDTTTHPLLVLENKYGDHSDNAGDRHGLKSYELLPHVFKQEPVSPQGLSESHFHQTTSPLPSVTLPPTPTPSPPQLVPIDSLPEAALDLSQDSPYSQPSIDEPSPCESSPQSCTSSQDPEDENLDGFPSKHKQFMEHTFDSEYWQRALTHTTRATLSAEHKSKLNAMVTAYLSFVEEFSRDDELKDLRPLWRSQDLSEQTQVFQKQVIHQLATVISFVHVIPGK